MPKRPLEEPSTSDNDAGHESTPFEEVLVGSGQCKSKRGEPPAKKLGLDIKEESIEEQNRTLSSDENLVTVKEEGGNGREEDDDEESGSPIAAMEEDEDEEDDFDSLIDKNNIPPPSISFMKCCSEAKLPCEIAIGAWEMYYHAAQRVSLEGSEAAWQLCAIYYYLLSKGVKRRGKASRLLTQKFPVSILTVVNSFDVCVAELLDKTVRFIDIIHSTKMRRYLDYVRRIQEGLAVSCVIFKKFCTVFREIFVEIKEGSDSCPTSLELFTVLWTSYLVMKSRLAMDDLISNYQLLFSMIDQLYADMCSMKDGIIHHLNQDFVGNLITSDVTIIRALCNQFGGCVLDARHFQNHTYQKMEKTGIPSTWNFLEFRDMIMNVPKDAYDEYLLLRGCIDERIFIPSVKDFSKIFKKTDPYMAATILKTSYSGRLFKDAEFLNRLSNSQCLEKLSHGKSESDRLSQSRELHRVPCVEYHLELGNYPEDEANNQSYKRLERILDGWKLESSVLKEKCEAMSDNPMATILLKCDEITSKFQRTLSSEQGETDEDIALNEYHTSIRKELEKIFLIFIEKIIIAELKKKVREEDLLNVIRREEFLDSVFCFCVELILFSNGYDRPFPWSANLCDVHPFMFHKIIDLMITHEKRLSRQMVRHFSKIEESVNEFHAWKSDSPLWPMAVRCPFTHFQEFGEDWSDKLNAYSPMKFTPIKKADDLRDELGRPILPQNQTSRTLRIFLKRTYFTASRRMQELTDRVGMGSRAKSQCWSLFDYLLRNDTLIFMDRHIDQICLCCVFVVLKINESQISFSEIIAQYRRQSKNAPAIYRSVTVFADLLNPTNPKPINTKETILERLEAPYREKKAIDIIKFYNIEFRDRIKYIIGQIDSASDEDLMEMPVPTTYGLMPVKVHITPKLSIQMLPKTKRCDSKQEKAIAHLVKSGLTLETVLGRSAD